MNQINHKNILPFNEITAWQSTFPQTNVLAALVTQCTFTCTLLHNILKGSGLEKFSSFQRKSKKYNFIFHSCHWKNSMCDAKTINKKMNNERSFPKKSKYIK